MTSIYLDNAAATPVLPEVLEAMTPYFIERYGNPGSVHAKGQEGRRAVDVSRRVIAEILNCDPREIIFTASGTESDNLAIQGICNAYGDEVRKGGVVPHIITSKVEHSAVLNTVEYLEKNRGFEVTYVGTDEYGRVSPEDVESAIKEETVFCSIMYANNEIGTVNPIKEIAEVCKGGRRDGKGGFVKGRYGDGVIFHIDACQVGGALSLDVKELGVDLMTINGSKIYGPKGVGVLFKKQGIKLVPMIFGGEGQEHRLRAGTENVPAIVGMAKALEIAEEFRKSGGREKMSALRDFLAGEILKRIPDSFLNGPPCGKRIGQSVTDRLPNNVNVSFAGVDGAALLMRLDQEGIYCTSGSACTSGSLDPSHVLLAIGRNEELATGALRLTLGRSTTKKDVEYVISILPKIIAELRNTSPLYVQR